MQRSTVSGFFFASFLLLLALQTRPLLAADAARRPNIVFIIADDLGYRDLGAFGQDKIKTPNLDRMAADGMKLTSMYSGNTVCAPSRAVLMSGKHPGHAYVRDNRQAPGDRKGSNEGQTPVPPDELVLPLSLKSLDYATGAFGKWGLGPWASTGNPNKQGIDRFYGYICQAVAHNYYPAYLWDNGKQVDLQNTEYERPAVLAEGADPNDPASYARFNQHKEFAPDLIHARALQFLRDNKEKPFFLFYPTTIPHLGYQVPDDSLKEYDGKFPEELYPGQGNYVPTNKPRATYAAMITRMDRDIGQLMSTVSELGLEENTIFVFVSDNGAPGGIPTNYFKSGANFRGAKGSAYEGGFRVPAIVKWKGHVQPGSTSDRVVGFEDFLPTLLELAGAKEQTPSSDGISFAATLRGETQTPRPFLYREFPARGGAQIVRVDHWRLVRHLGDNDRRDPRQDNPMQKVYRRPPGAAEPEPAGTDEFELFDLASDPSEQHNVAAKHPEVLEQLKKIMTEQHTPSELFPLRNVDPSRKEQKQG